MIELGVYEGKNLPFFKSFSMDLSRRGITLIRGINKLSDENRNNGSGKSLLVSGIAEVMMASNPAISGNEAFARKTLFPHKDSRISLEINQNMVVKGRFGGATVQFAIEDSNGALEKVTRDAAGQYLLDSIGYNEEMFYSVVYLDCGRDNLLVSGTPLNRLNFLSNLFVDLIDFESYRVCFDRMARDLKAIQNRHEEIKSQLAAIDGGTSTSTEELKSQKATLLSDKKRLRKEIQLYRKRLESLAAQAKISSLEREVGLIAERFGSDRLPLPDWRDGESVAQFRKQAEALALEWSVALAQMSNHQKWQERHKQTSDRIKKAEREMQNLRQQIAELDVPDKETDPEYAALRDGYWQGLRLIAEQLDEMALLHRPPTVEVLGQLVQSIMRWNWVANNGYELASPALNLKDYSKELKSLATTLKRLQQEYPDKSALLSRPDDAPKLTALKTRLAEKTAARDKLKRELAKLLDSEVKCDFQDQSTIEDHVKSLSSLGRIAIELSGLIEANPEPTDGTEDEAEKELQDKIQELAQIESKLSSLERQLGKAEAAESSLSTLQVRDAKYTKHLERAPAVNALKEAFSNRGIKNVMLFQSIQRLQDLMNLHSSLVFPEPVEIEFSLKTGACDITLTHVSSSNQETTDVRTLSRSEKRSFTLLLSYCLRLMIPAERQVSVMILDEATANMDQPTKARIFDYYVPALQKLVPHVIILDTGTLEIEGARNLYVVKDQKGSRLVESSDA